MGQFQSEDRLVWPESRRLFREAKKVKTPEELSNVANNPANDTIKNNQALRPQETDKPYKHKLQKHHQRPDLMDYVHLTSPADKVTHTVKGTEEHPVNLDLQLLNNTGPEGLRFDDHGMVLPHSILGGLEDFRSYLQTKGETDLVKRIPKSLRDLTSEATGRPSINIVQREISSDQRNFQSNALQQWDKHMKHRRLQQDLLSYLLDRPLENLLMNQTNHFREIQEQKEILSQVMPLIHSGYGYRVGSEFWSLPQRYGDEVSGITATLTQAELGRQKPVTHVGIPNSIRQELGISSAGTVHPASRTWDQNAYLQHQYQEQREVLQNLDIKKPDISGLEVIGSGKLDGFITVRRSPSLEKEEEEKDHKQMKEKFDPLAQFDDVQGEALLIPALRFCGELASWTGNSTSSQGEVGISATIIFEAQTGEKATSHLELHNEGNTAIFYGWQPLTVPHSFPHLSSQTKTMHFYFNSSSGVIRPGDTKRVEFIFKSEKPGIKTELWQLNTHPVLLQGAAMQIKLRGVALCQDKTADQRLYIEKKLEKIVVGKTCRSIVYEVLRRVHSPKKPSSPAELYITEEQQFKNKNPKLQYFDQPVQDLKRLWNEVNQACTWDLSVDTLRQVVLSLPDEKKTLDSPTKEESLAQLNSVVLQLSEPSELKYCHLSAVTIGQQLWKQLLDTMADEAARLRNLLGLPEKEMHIHTECESMISDAEDKNEKKAETAAKEEQSLLRSRFKDDSKGELKPPTNENSLEESKKRGKRKDDTGKHSKEKLGKESPSLTDTCSESIIQWPSDDQSVDSERIHFYTRILHKKVYALMEDLVDNLCGLVDEINVGDGQDTKH
ncbi:MYCBP-associated protein [Leuresthes tenuis]|uniref:MYCBP-associated protein n=1 Tax=Leuresthes tenuis TaxID=355514 RepID=UPI003B501792